MNTTNDTDYEEIIGTALLTGDHATAMRRTTCKLAASTAMFCGCGQVHDQKKIHVIEIVYADNSEKTVAALCPGCFKKQEPTLQTTVDKVAKDYRDNDQAPPHIRVATWSKSIVIESK